MVTTARSRVTSLFALIAVVGLLAASCSDDGGDDAATDTTAAAAEDGATTTTVAADGEAPSDSPAASLRSNLVGLLEEQVYLIGFTVQATVDEGVGSDLATASEQESSASATELSNLIGGGYGVAAGNDFLAAWNDHREAILAYGTTDGPVEAIASTRQAVLDTLAEIDASAAFTGVGDALEESDTALITTVDELVAGEPAAAADLRAAAAPMPGVALDLATAIATEVAVDGEVDSPESALRAELTGLLQESALLTGLALAETVAADGNSDAPGPAGVLAAVEENTRALADAMEPDDEAAADEFADLWAGHIDTFEAYATALVADDAAGLTAARESLIAFRDDLGALLAERYPAFTQQQVAEELVGHTDSILSFVDALVTEDVNEAPARLREAAEVMRLTARTLTGGLLAPVAEDEPAEE